MSVGFISKYGIRQARVTFKVDVSEFQRKIREAVKRTRKMDFRIKRSQRLLATSSATRTNSPARRAGSRRTKRYAHRRPR